MRPCCVERVQTAVKKKAVEKQARKSDPAAAAPPPPRTDVSVQSDEQAAYVAAWRVDRALQLAAGVSSFCTCYY